MKEPDQLLALLTSPRTSAELQQSLSVSQATVSRLIKKAGPAVIVIGRSRATRYQAATDVFGSGYVQGLFEVDDWGTIRQIGELRALASGGFYVTTDESHWWLRGVDGNGVFESLPFFLFDLAPSGFLGRIEARTVAEEWGFPADPRRWNDKHIGRYLLRRGLDLPGNLILGESAARRANELTPKPIGARSRTFPRLVKQMEASGPVGSSAVGEQPKFTCYDSTAGHLIVKYSPRGDAPTTVRVKDLLRAEAFAQKTLREQCSVAVADCVIRNIGDRVYLESRRFDREGERGRSAALSMFMVDAEFVGEGQGWTQVGWALENQSLLSEGDLSAIAYAETFGHWIGNNDMHLGNLSLEPRSEGFSLRPIYDMGPMAFAPRDGNLPSVSLRAPLRTNQNDSVWDATREAAVEYFSSIANDTNFSEDFRRIAASESRRCRLSADRSH